MYAELADICKDRGWNTQGRMQRIFSTVSRENIWHALCIRGRARMASVRALAKAAEKAWS